ncbi:MAG TPA: non-homologous end-joining DNA ligase [Tepidisphaeraceae bacterium]|nr:non-homologous end-joining DNA ligase [Tepidisphaeraceae bacterium]
MPRAKRESSTQVKFSHLDKLMFPEANVTKGDILKFYADIAKFLLPHLKNRPATLERLPDGLNGPRFFQKNAPDYYPDWIPRINLPTEEGKPVNYVIVNDLNSLLYLVNQGTITFHTHLSRVKSLEQPDYVLFDLDPGDREFTDVVTIAKAIHKLLDAGKVKHFIKTSGKRGLHILAKPAKIKTYEEGRSWAVTIAERVVKELPEIATMERSIAKRRGRLYLDVMQNSLGKHVVPPYVLRATPLATVSTPLDWKEVTAKLTPKKFTMDPVVTRMKRKTDPMAALVK